MAERARTLHILATKERRRFILLSVFFSTVPRKVSALTDFRDFIDEEFGRKPTKTLALQSSSKIKKNLSYPFGYEPSPPKQKDKNFDSSPFFSPLQKLCCQCSNFASSLPRFVHLAHHLFLKPRCTPKLEKIGRFTGLALPISGRERRGFGCDICHIIRRSA